MRVLHIAFDYDEVEQSLARALALGGARITVAVPISGIERPESHGLARRLTPLSVAVGDERVEVVLHEGKLKGGRGALVAFELPEGSGDAAQIVCRGAIAYATADGATLDVVRASRGAEAALEMFPGETRPTLVYDTSDVGDTDTLLAASKRADRVVVPAPAAARELAAQLECPVSGILRGARPRRPDIPDKAEAKKELQRDLDLAPRPDTPMVAVLGPFAEPGIAAAIDGALATAEAQVVFLAQVDRDRDAPTMFGNLADKHARRSAVRSAPLGPEYDDLRHRFLAAADLQLYAHDYDLGGPCELDCLGYRTAPVAPDRGGFADILVEYDPETGTGSGFLYEDGEMGDALARGLRAFTDDGGEGFAAVADQLLAVDLSWKTAAVRYLDLYRETTAARLAPPAPEQAEPAPVQAEGEPASAIVAVPVDDDDDGEDVEDDAADEEE